MTKTEFIEKIAEACALKTSQATKIINTALGVVTDELAQGGSVNLIGFGKFSVKNRNARNGRNPRTGEPIQIPASKTVHFAAGRALKGVVNHD